MTESALELADQVAAVARRHLGHEFTYEEALTHVRTIKVILAADGVSDTEMWAMRKALEDIGVPEALQREAETFDPSTVRLEDLLRGVPKGSRRALEAMVDLENRVRDLGDPALREKLTHVAHAMLAMGA